MSLVLTKAAVTLKNAEANFQVVKFESYKPKKKEVSSNDQLVGDRPTRHSSQSDSKKNTDLKRIRHEIVRFGMSGFDATKKEEAKIALAVSLGAKPPKREYINYKELMKKRKEENAKQKETKDLMQAKSVLQRTVKKKKGPGNDVGHFLSSYGKVQKKDLKKDDKKGPRNKKTKKLL